MTPPMIASRTPSDMVHCRLMTSICPITSISRGNPRGIVHNLWTGNRRIASAHSREKSTSLKRRHKIKSLKPNNAAFALVQHLFFTATIHAHFPENQPSPLALLITCFSASKKNVTANMTSTMTPNTTRRNPAQAMRPPMNCSTVFPKQPREGSLGACSLVTVSWCRGWLGR